MFDDLVSFQHWNNMKFMMIDDSIIEKKINFDFERTIRYCLQLCCLIDMYNNSDSITEEFTPTAIISGWT